MRLFQYFVPRLSACCLLVAAVGCGGGETTTTTTHSTTGSGGSTSTSDTTSTGDTGSSTSGSTTSSSHTGGTGGATTTSSTASGGGGMGGTTTSSTGSGGSTGSTSTSTDTTSTSTTTTAPPCTSDAQCDDGKFCNGVETCDPANGDPTTGCKAGTPPSCDDSISCTVDACDTTTDACTHTPSDAACSDGKFCTGVETCDPANGAAGTGCKAGTPPTCDDGKGCTVDACDTTLDACTNLPNNTMCDDGRYCTGVETCDPVNGDPTNNYCLAGTPPACDDGITCTADFCDQTADLCQHVPSDTACSDGAFCNGAEKCDPANGDPTTGCVAGTPPVCNDGIGCTIDGCSDALGQCTHTASDAACSDGAFCNGAEKCDPANGDPTTGCIAGTPPSCDDGLTCTIDACSDTLGQCTHTPVNSACDDGVYCNGVETCSTNGPTPSGCVAGTPPQCVSDGIACTVDACDEATKSCQHTPDNTLCPSGEFCIVAQGGCKAGTPCTTSAQCDDGDACNGVEACVKNLCVPGTPVNCDDGLPCTVDACNKTTGACSHAPNNALCDDGVACNGAETCDPLVGCVDGTPVVCDDGIACTTDTCTEPNGACVYLAQDLLCNDGKLCNGAEKCDPANGDPTTGCAAGTPYVCPSNGIACDVMVCDPVLNACKPVPHDELCPCGQTCDPAQGCGNHCVVSTCQGKVYACGDCLDNDGDCKIDSADDQCLNPCDNTEDSFYGGIPGQGGPGCAQDCYFDADSGAGNDDCYWDHRCDPHEVATYNYSPEWWLGTKCAYNPNYKIATGMYCSNAITTQSAQCNNYCGPLTPNGCDCFGCCQIPVPNTNNTVTVWLGTEDGSGHGSCTIDALTDPHKCAPCTQVQGACLNTCEHCELCVGKTELPADCTTQTCPAGSAACGLAGQAPCLPGSSCITGCCIANPN